MSTGEFPLTFILYGLIVPFLVTLPQFGTPSRYVRKSEPGSTTLRQPMVPVNDSILELMYLCTNYSKTPCPADKVKNMTHKIRHLEQLGRGKLRIMQVIQDRTSIWKLILSLLIFGVALTCGIYLICVNHISCRFGGFSEADGSFGYDLKVMEVKGFKISPISKEEYEKNVAQKIREAMKALDKEEAGAATGDEKQFDDIGPGADAPNAPKVGKKSKKEPSLWHHQRKLDAEARQKFANEEALLKTQVKQDSKKTQKSRTEYFASLLTKYPPPNQAPEGSKASQAKRSE